MKKYLMIFAAMMSVTMSSCTKEQTVDDPATDPDVPAAGNKSSFTFLKVDQSRIITPKVDTRAMAGVTRASLPEGAADLEQIKALMKNAKNFSTITNDDPNYPATFVDGEVYVATKPWSGNFQFNNAPNFTLIVDTDLVASAVWAPGNGFNNAKIYIMPNASLQWLDYNGQTYMLRENVEMHCWGNLSLPIKSGLAIKDGANLYIYDNEEDSRPFEITDNGDYYIGSLVLDGGNIFCSKQANFGGHVLIKNGSAHFTDEVHIGKCLRLQGEGNPTIDFDACTYIGGTISNNQCSVNATLNIKNYLECNGLQGQGGKGAFTINLEAATLMIKDPANLPSDYADTWDPVNNRKISYIYRNSFTFVGKKIGQYYSAVYFGDHSNGATTSTLLLYPNETLQGTIDSNGYFKDLSMPTFQGDLNVIAFIEAGNIWNPIGTNYGHGYALSVDNIKKGENQDNLQLNGDTSEFPVHDTCEIENGGGVVTPPDEPDPTPATTKHKYSATGIDYDPDTGCMYICWHSNIAGDGEMQDEGQHDHGTNVDPDNDDDDYAGPSVEGKDDWGGIIDVLDLNQNTYDPATWIFSTTAIQHEHKYNHVKFHKNKLYLASTSNKVGAALHVVPVQILKNGEDIDYNIDIDGADYRVNLVGGSANCVEVVPDAEGDEHLATISGRTVGGVNWFYIDEDENQTKRYVNSDDTKNFGGKYICYYNNEVVTLNNTSNATVTVYTIENGTGKLREKRRFQTGVKLAPYDGKNAMVVKHDKVYICCGSNGLHVFDYNSTGDVKGKEVYTFDLKVSANCVDVDDDGYMYVATGDGLAVYNNMPNNEGINKLNEYKHYTGTGFAFNENTSGEKLPDNTVKSSSNFVRVIGDNAYVAYGMFGLRIYPLKELRPM